MEELGLGFFKRFKSYRHQERPGRDVYKGRPRGEVVGFYGFPIVPHMERNRQGLYMHRASVRMGGQYESGLRLCADKRYEVLFLHVKF
jgi:hypothetical protein